MPLTGAQAADANPVRPKLRPETPISCYSPLGITITIIVLLGLASYCSGAEENAAGALLKFKSSLANKDPALAHWDPIKPPCSGYNSNWNGVLCFDSYVWGLQLENMTLQGQIDVDSLVPLRFLRTLSFKNNSFQGSMPDWRKLGALKSLFLSNNKFSGQIPMDAFKGMTSLKKVDLANNQFTGQIPSSLQSPKLIELRLENNQFTGTIPSISSDNLKIFNVSNNMLDGPIPDNLQNIAPSSFSGNKALCGKPLDVSCTPRIPPPDLEPSLDSPPGISPSNAPAAVAMNEKKSSTTAVILMFVILGLILIIVFLLVYVRSRRSPTPRLGREGSAPYDEKSLSVEAAALSASAHVVVDQTTAVARRSEQVARTATVAAAAGKLTFVKEDRQKFDLPDLMRASAEVLGSGNFGASYKAVLVDGEALVVKRFKHMNNVAKEDFHEHMRRIGRLKHPNLLPLVAYLYRKEEKLLVSDYICNGSLATHLHGQCMAQNFNNLLFILKILQSELPSLNLPHGHLKSSNVLLDNHFNPLLMDHSLAPVVNPSQVHQILVAYKSPEYSLTGRTSQNSRTQMEKLLQIGIACCHEDVDKRWDLEMALNQIEQVQER